MNHICLGCRRQISRIALRKATQRTFISLATPPTPDTIKDTTSTKKLILELETYGDRADVSDQVAESHVNQPAERRKRPPAASNSPGDQLEAFFQQALILTPAASVQMSAATRFQHAARLDLMLSNNEVSVLDCWNFFMEHFGPDTWGPRTSDEPSTLAMGYFRDKPLMGPTLMKKLLLSKSTENLGNPLPMPLPSYTKICKFYYQLGLLSARAWTDMIIILSGRILAYTEDAGRSIEDAGYRNMYLDLLGLWDVPIRDGTDNADNISSTKPRPALENNVVINTFKSHKERGAFLLYTPKFCVRKSVKHGKTHLPLASVATYYLLAHKCALGHIHQLAGPLISNLGQIISVTGFDTHRIYPGGSRSWGTKDFSEETHKVLQEIKNNWSTIRDRLDPSLRREQVEANVQKSPKQAETAQSPAHRDAAFEPFIAGRTQEYLDSGLKTAIRMATERKDQHELEKLWSEYQYATLETNPGERKRPPRTGSAEVCNSFLYGYMALRLPDKAIEVWNHMETSKLPRNLKSWDTMMMGCRIAHDPDAMEAVWAQMQPMGVQPDVQCWTTRVAGLLEGRRSETCPTAIMALDEMGRRWLKAARSVHGEETKLQDLTHVGDVNGVAKPAITVVNAAVSRMLVKGLSQDAFRVLAWAGKFGVQPDIATYNVLLRHYVREGRNQEADALISSLHRDGLVPDTATFSTLLEETFRSNTPKTVEEQQELVEEIFASMEEQGFKADAHTYGKVIHELLQTADGNLTVVNAVMERMNRRNHKPTIFIYTDLIKYYFRRPSPDLDAVRVLIDQVKKHEALAGQVNIVFWASALEGYARAGDTTSALMIFGQVRQIPAMGHFNDATYYILLKALIQKNDLDAARALVESRCAETGWSPGMELSPRQMYRKGNFLGLAGQYNLLPSTPRYPAESAQHVYQEASI